ncbi:VHS-domain-containing protein [Nadsonia fulvescens var. elongata DSM 6958]|uniref:VHS-domain-containing protein n=1 Tax=Nadsonia fulvescens var. elongata DSM 6958 TaxID=857566 RepID=A0A1E3PI60_9ASCO|nr:VHS-domain-containing protein [Nadsonia fulvescens var. elongata DSM 6958]
MSRLQEYHDDPVGSDASSNQSNMSSDYLNRFRADDDSMYPVRAPAVPPGFGSTPGFSAEPAKDKNAKLNRLIAKAVSLIYHEPNLAINLEVADYINKKKGSFVHDAATNIVEKINNGNSHTAVLAVALLDICVKNCGYPFHLQISRKDFLNQLVKCFPYHAPSEYTKVQFLILELLQEWVETICKTASYKNDLIAIVQIHNYLAAKGYVFPKINLTEAAVLNQPDDNLKTINELKKEETEVQQAKLQELIRSGRPEDLREANKLMKILAGFQNTDNDKDSYREKYKQIIEQIKNKSELLYEMLQVVSTPEELHDNEIIKELLVSVKSTKPKLEKIISESAQNTNEDSTEYQTCQDLMNSINLIIQRHDLIKQGDMTSANLISDSLIDFGDSTAPSPTDQSSIKNHDKDDSGTDIFGSPQTKLDIPLSSKPSTHLEDLLDGLNFNQSNDSVREQPLMSPTVTVKPDSQKAVTSMVQGPHQIILDTPDRLKITVFFSRLSEKQVALVFKFENNSILSLTTDVNFQLSLPRSLSVNLEPISQDKVEPFSSTPVTQRAVVSGVDPDHEVKFKWKVSYQVDETPVEVNGMVKGLKPF